MEWIGIPAVTIAHEALAGSVEAMKTICKMPTYPYLQVKFPHSAVGRWSDEELEKIIDELLPNVVGQLTDRDFASKFGPREGA